jgi:regulatory protein
MILDLSFDWKAPKPAAPDRHTALKKATHYCGYQERSHKDLRNKLYDLGVWTSDVEEIITEMILKGSLSEERFALHYVAEKFKTNQWGKIKIKHGLRAKNIPDQMIERILNCLDPDTYINTLKTIASKKLSTIKLKNKFQRRYTLTEYLLRQGYEYQTIKETIKYWKF